MKAAIVHSFDQPPMLGVAARGIARRLRGRGLEVLGSESFLLLNPVNAWTATLILAVALDLARQGVVPTRRDR